MTPAVVDGMDEAAYHAHPALSSSGARRILPPYCPAKFKWQRDNGRPEKRAFDFGHAAHGEVLGVGAEVITVQKVAKDGTVSNATDYATKSAQQHRDEIYAQGKTPLLAHERLQVLGMAEALRAHPIAGPLFAQAGRPEVSLFWRDDQYDVDRRARVDYLPDPMAGRVALADYKTCISADPYNICKSIANYGYHQQAAWYIDSVLALGIAETVDFRLIFQEKYAPYLTTVVELDATSLAVGRSLNDRALEVFARCSATDTWPSYTSEIETVSLPIWALGDELEMSL